MILQEINLYQERFKEKKIWLSAQQLSILIGLSIVILAFSSYWYNNQYQLAEQLKESYIIEKDQKTQQLAMQRQKLESLLGNNQIDKEITKVSADISVRKKIIDFVENNQFGSGEGFSVNLSSLSEININNIWLNEISLSTDYIKLSGSALKAERVPEYFNLFRQQQLFNGRVFEVFELDRSQDQNWKVDFLIASREASNE